MRARSEKLGAQFDINSKPGNGTEIVLRLPLREM
jgi:signal transduction histidine kinase